jgi:uncharacterized protein
MLNAASSSSQTGLEHCSIYYGFVEHDRRRDVRHCFSVPLTLWYIDLAAITALPGLRPWFGRAWWSPLSFRREDYFPGPRSLRDSILDKVEHSLGFRPTGSIHLLTQLRTFGIVFNPVSFAYCRDLDGVVVAIVAEITNTPWRERYCYVVDPRTDTACVFDKTFHVSPFQPMTQRYEWRFSTPGSRLCVAMANRSTEGLDFSARLLLSRRPLTVAGAARAVISRPIQTLMVLARIYIEALRLWCKGAQFFTHPSKRLPAVSP